MKDEGAQKWLKRLAGDRYVEHKEESRAMPYFMYSGDPADNLDRIRGMRKAQDKQDKQVMNGKHKGGGR